MIDQYRLLANLVDVRETEFAPINHFGVYSNKQHINAYLWDCNHILCLASSSSKKEDNHLSHKLVKYIIFLSYFVIMLV